MIMEYVSGGELFEYILKHGKVHKYSAAIHTVNTEVFPGIF